MKTGQRPMSYAHEARIRTMSHRQGRLWYRSFSGEGPMSYAHEARMRMMSHRQGRLWYRSSSGEGPMSYDREARMRTMSHRHPPVADARGRWYRSFSGGLILWLGLALALAATACGQSVSTPPPGPTGPRAERPAPAQSEWDKTVAAGKKEGKVMVYTIIGPETRGALSAAFKDKYGIDLEFVSGARGAELTQKLRTERQAGLHLADVVIAGTTDLIPDLKPKGLLEPMDKFLVLPEATDAGAWRDGKFPFLDKDHTAVGMLTQYLRFMVRNTDMVKAGEVTSYKDLLKPQWKGKAVLRDPTTTGAANTWVTFLSLKAWGMEEARTFLKAFAQTEPAILRDTRLHVEWVARGKFPLGVATRMEDTGVFMRMGAPIAWVSVAEGGLVSPGSSSLGIIKDPAHPHATRLFVNWLLTREGQTAFIRGYAYPSARTDVPTDSIPPGNLPSPGEKFYLDDEDNVLAKSEMLAVGKEIFGSLVK